MRMVRISFSCRVGTTFLNTKVAGFPPTAATVLTEIKYVTEPYKDHRIPAAGMISKKIKLFDEDESFLSNKQDWHIPPDLR